MEVSKKDTKRRIEKVLSEILSDKYGLKIDLKFVRRSNCGNCDKTKAVRKE